ncbi:VTT domain-containing protein [Escherichia coli]
MLIAAIVGDAVNYTIGRLFFGEKLFIIPIRKFSVAVISTKPISFMRNMAAKRLFSPVFADRQNVRPFVAGMGRMSYRHFAAYNVIGALLWVLLFTYAGYFFGTIPMVQDNLKLLIVGIILVFFCRASSN